MLHSAPRIRLAVAGALLVAAVPAQRTWVVSARGGPGVNFTDIPPAIAAAADGDILVVRPGSYGEVQITGKGLSVIGEAGVQVANLQVYAVSAAQRVVVTDIEVVGSRVLFLLPGVVDARGFVLWERVVLRRDSFPPTFNVCSDLRLSSCDIEGSVSIASSNVTITDSQLRPRFDSAVATLSVAGSRVTLSRCTVTGMNENVLRQAAQPAIELVAGSILAATDDGTNLIVAGQPGFHSAQPSAIVGSGSFVRDPRVRVYAGMASPVWGPVETVRPIATLRALGAPVGGNVQVELSGAVGQAFALVVGLPGPPVPLPRFGGTLGLSTWVLVALGVFTAPTHGLSLRVAPGLPPGFTLAWQAVAGDTQGGWQLSNVATYAHTN